MEGTPRIIKVSSGALQDLWDAIREASTAQHATTIDLEGAAFSGRVSGLQISVCEGTKAMYDKVFNVAATRLTVQNGQVDLGHYGLLITAGTCCFRNVQLTGEGPSWRRRTSASLVHVVGRTAHLQLDHSSLTCTAQEPVNTMLVENGAHVALTHSKVSHSNHALGIKVLGGTLDATNTEFTGHHESLAVLTTRNATAQPLVKQPGQSGPPDESSMVKLQGCSLSGAGPGTIGTVCSVIGSRSSLTALQCVIQGAAVAAVVSRGAWLVIEESTVTEWTVGGIWCSGGHAQATECRFHSHPTPAVRIERKGSIELRRCVFRAPESLPLGMEAVGLSIDGNGAFARSVDCSYEGFGPSAIVETAGGSFLVEEGVQDATRLPA